ncbi:MAG: hypothetical protein GY791_19060, partial [Alphaproteobacteria bacterium]|nr:hypothetical protein [Alphaproteobacteria bacterium]
MDDALVDGTQTVTVRAIAVGHADGTDTIDVTDDEVGACVLDVKFEETILSVGMEYYTDRTYTFTNVPALYIGLDMIKTPNANSNRTTASGYLTFELQNNATVYVAYDQRATSLPDWLSVFTDTGDTIDTSLSTQQFLKVYSKDFLSGDCVDLGANKAAGFSGGTVSNYVVFYETAAPPASTSDDLVLQNETVVNGETKVYTARYTITAGPSFTVASGGEAILKAGSLITLLPGFHAQEGSKLTARVWNDDTAPSVVSSNIPEGQIVTSNGGPFTIQMTFLDDDSG